MSCFRSFCLVVFIGFVALMATSEVQAGPLDGRYESNMGNNLVIRGSSYTYSRGRGEPWRTSGSVRSTGGNGFRFSGYLSYPCTREGTSLVCGGGRRVWTKQ